ncbi:MAG: SRPBCC domain-containing protein [Planctomycetes bacterium]|nr:SRPBCC domain-containing protein [Planctomycetota bacterium]
MSCSVEAQPGAVKPDSGAAANGGAASAPAGTPISGERAIRLETVVDAPRTAVWRAWTTAAGIESFFASKARVDLAIDGVFEVLFSPDAPEGSRGAEGCRILSYLPYEMLSFDWSAPPSIPSLRNSGARTHVILRFRDAEEGKTAVSFVQLGFGTGEDWDAYYAYFTNAWPRVMKNLAANAARYSALPLPREPEAAPLRHEVEVDAAPDRVWEALTTKQGMESWMVAHADVDWRVGGKIRTNYDPQGVLGDPGTIENTILAYEPLRMYSIKATRAPENFPFKRAIDGMWSVLELAPLESGRTRVTLTGLGFGNDEESQAMRSFFERGNALTLEKLRSKFAPGGTQRAAAVGEGEAVSGPLASLARLVGAWHMDGTWEDPSKGSIRVENEWGLNHRVLKTKSFRVSESGEQLVYETFSFWHPQKKQIVFYSISAGGTVYDGVIAAEGDTLTYTWAGYAADSVTDYRQTLRFPDDGTYIWTVFVKDTEEWKQIKEGVLRREAPTRRADGAPGR